jgi:hypothetical protein
MVVVVVKAPPGFTVAYTAGSPAKSRVWTNASEIKVTGPGQSGPTDPYTVTVSPR